jgi:signal transduction histidine kinase
LATAVARDVSPGEIFASIAREIGLLVGADDVEVARRESTGAATLVGGAGRWVAELGVGVRVGPDDSPAIATVFRTGRTTRLDEQDYGAASGPVADYLRKVGRRSAVASPIVVTGRLWGAIVASTTRSLLPADAEERMTDFAELIGVVIANVENRIALTASRARLVSAGDEARRRIQRDLHDGAQQRLASTVIALKLARRELGGETGPVVELLNEALEHAERANSELRELAHGILPDTLRRGGLRAGIEGLIAHVRLPVSVDVTTVRLPLNIEATAYFIVAEALTNAVRHARASRVQITADFDGNELRLEVRDDGIGGARTDRSSGLLGLGDRAAALNGALHVHSPPGKGTQVTATLPIQDT